MMGTPHWGVGKAFEEVNTYQDGDVFLESCFEKEAIKRVVVVS